MLWKMHYKCIWKMMLGYSVLPPVQRKRAFHCPPAPLPTQLLLPLPRTAEQRSLIVKTRDSQPLKASLLKDSHCHLLPSPDLHRLSCFYPIQRLPSLRLDKVFISLVMCAYRCVSTIVHVWRSEDSSTLWSQFPSATLRDTGITLGSSSLNTKAFK